MIRLLRRAAPMVLVAAVFLITVELLRAATPLLDLAAGRTGVVGAAGLAVLIFTAPALVGGLVAVTGAARAAGLTVAALLSLRLVAQAQSPATLLVVGAGAAVGIGALLLAVRTAATARSGVTATTGVLVGAVADLAIRAGFSSWDPIFQPGPIPWLVTLAGCGVAGAAVLAGWPRQAAAPAVPAPSPVAPGRRLAVLGPYLALYLMAYGSAPILAAHAGLSLPAASAVLIGTAVVGMEVVRRLRLPGGSGAIPEPDRWFAGTFALVGLVAGGAVGYWLTGPVVVAGFAVAGLSAAVLLARALAPSPEKRTPPPEQGSAHRPAPGYAVAGFAAGLGYLLPVMIYQLHYDLEFPVDNRLGLLAAALLVGVAGAGTRRRPREATRDPRPARLFAAPAAVSVLAAAALLVPASVALARPAPVEADQVGASVRVMSWNLMYGRHHTRGEIDFESIAATVAEVDPDVLLLQEVSRGWPIGGGGDLVEWLSRRLDLPYEWSPAADGQFGNALFTRLDRGEVTAARLPFRQGPMERSYLDVTLSLAGDRELRVINTHLQHRKGNTPSRLVQIEALLEVWDGAPRTVIAGDFNFWPTWQEPRRFAAAGFVSAQDVTGHGAQFTGPTDDPDNRVDWIFGTPDLRFSEFSIVTDATNSDHFPLVVTIHLN